MVILAALAVITVAVLIPRIGGATPYTILTGSMQPAMPPGTLVISKPTPVGDIGVGTVITYQLASGQPQVVTHRVVAVGEDRHGEPIFRTQGDANPTPDRAWVRPVQIKGERWYFVPYLGRVNTLITGGVHQSLLVAAVGGLLLYAAAMFIGAARDRTGRP